MSGEATKGESQERKLERKLGEYAGRVVAVAGEFPDGSLCRHIQDQLARSGTAPGAHYAEARSAQSTDDFVHKISLAAKEARESLYWLRVTAHAGLVDRDLESTIELADRLVGWLHASMHTARQDG